MLVCLPPGRKEMHEPSFARVVSSRMLVRGAGWTNIDCAHQPTIDYIVASKSRRKKGSNTYVVGTEQKSLQQKRRRLNIVIIAVSCCGRSLLW